jgi:hypothetical protein
MPLLTLAEAELHYGDLPLLDRAALAGQLGPSEGLIALQSVNVRPAA